jgi:hypothetical protein
MARQITCINKNDRYNWHERITHVGGSWGKITQQDAIRLIEQDPQAFYVHVHGHSVWVVVASRNGVKYIKSQNDSDTPDNLLSLSECR